MKSLHTSQRNLDNNHEINIEHDVNIHLENRQLSRHFFWFIWLLYAVVYMTKNCFNAALTSIVAEGILTKSQTGVITSAFYLAYAPMQIVGGIMADRYSPERLVKIGLIGGAISNILIFFNQNYYAMLAIWVFNAVIQFGLWPGIFKIVASQLVRSDRTMMIFYITFSASCGMFLSYIIGAFLTDWKMNFAISAISLFVFAVALELHCRHLNPYMKWDRLEPVRGSTEKEKGGQLSTFRIFMVSGFFVVTIVALLRCMLEQGLKTITPVMLMESYENVSPKIGNLLNLLIIGSGMIGAIVVKKFLYPKRVRNELKGMAFLLVLAIPFTGLTMFIGKISLPVMIMVLCICCALYTGSGLFTSYYSNQFVKFGMNATVAGVINAAAAMGIVVAGYGFLRVSELWNWKAVTALWIGVATACVVLIGAILPTYKKFKEM